MTYTETLQTLATTTEKQVLAAFGSWQEGLIAQADFLAVAAAYLSAAGNRATALADTALAAYLTAHTGTAIPVLGLLPPEHDHRPVLATIAAMSGVDLAERFATYARATPLAVAQDAYGQAMTEREIPGWTRVLNAGACELCHDLAGPVLPGSAPMFHHKGCGCTQRPVLNTERHTA
jgi:hypothetical protein